MLSDKLDFDIYNVYKYASIAAGANKLGALGSAT